RLGVVHALLLQVHTEVLATIGVGVMQQPAIVREIVDVVLVQPADAEIRTVRENMMRRPIAQERMILRRGWQGDQRECDGGARPDQPASVSHGNVLVGSRWNIAVYGPRARAVAACSPCQIQRSGVSVAARSVSLGKTTARFGRAHRFMPAHKPRREKSSLAICASSR